jgi:hypothetical protein
MLFMPDPTFTWISSAPCRNVACERLQLIQQGPTSRTLPKEQNFLTFSFDSTFVTFFEHVLTFY